MKIIKYECKELTKEEFEAFLDSWFKEWEEKEANK